MSSLTGTKISDTYVGLLKTLDTTPLSATPKEISDGLGNASGVKLDNAGNLDVTNTVAFGSLKDTAEDITITKFVDEADGIENNDDDTSLPTSAAVKDYVDAYVTAQDLDFSGNTGTGDVDLDSEIFAITGSNGISTTAEDATLIIDGSVLETGIATNATDIATNVTNISTNATDIATNVTNIAANETNIATNTTNIATNTANITANTTDIETNATNISTNVTNIATNTATGVTNAANIVTNATNIATNTATGETNATNIATNVTDIATNATNIAANVTNIATNTATGVTNAANIVTNATGVATNATNIATNAAGVATNLANIATNTTGVATNATNIATNTATGVTNAANIVTNATGVATNATNIATNAAGVATNLANIATNTTGVATNATNIATNTTGVATNATNIATNTTGVATNATGISTNATGVTTNATNIATNTTGIATNVTNISTNTTGIATNVTNIATNTTGVATNATGISTNATGVATNATNIALKVSKAGDTMTGNLAIKKTTPAGDSGTLTLGDPATSIGEGDSVGGSIKFVNGFRSEETSITHQMNYELPQEFESNMNFKLDGQQFVSLAREVGSGYTNETVFIQKDTKFIGSQNRVLSANGYGFGSTYGDNFTIKDYEEGTYNITFSLRQDNSSATGGTNIGASGFTSFINYSRYVKVGRKVTLYLNLEYTDPISTNWNSSYYVALDNLPFAPTLDGVTGSAFGAGGTYNFESNYQTNTNAYNILVRNLGFSNYGSYITLGGGYVQNYPNSKRIPLRGDQFPQYNFYGNPTVKVKLLGVVEYYTSA